MGRGRTFQRERIGAGRWGTPVSPELNVPWSRRPETHQPETRKPETSNPRQGIAFLFDHPAHGLAKTITSPCTFADDVVLAAGLTPQAELPCLNPFGDDFTCLAEGRQLEIVDDARMPEPFVATWLTRPRSIRSTM
jgi:hypothetical protein